MVTQRLEQPVFTSQVMVPNCFKVTGVNYGSLGTIKVKVRAKNSGSHTLESYVYYIRDGKTQPTNVLSSRHPLLFHNQGQMYAAVLHNPFLGMYLYFRGETAVTKL